MTFREFTDGTLKAVEHMLATVQPPTGEIVPTLHVDGRQGLHILALAGAWFESDETRGRMIDTLLPTIRSLDAERVAWSFAATIHDDPPYGPTDTAIVVVTIDRERHETWRGLRGPYQWTRFDKLLTPIDWQQLPPNEQGGLLLTPIQQALR